TGWPFSSARYRPTASNRSRVNPRGLIIWWHEAHAWGRVWRATRWRVGRSGGWATAGGAADSGGGSEATPGPDAGQTAPRRAGGRGRRGGGEAGHQVGARQDAGARGGVEGDLLERGVGRQVGAVELRQAAVEIDGIGEQELGEVGGPPADHVVEEQVEGGPQV